MLVSIPLITDLEYGLIDTDTYGLVSYMQNAVVMKDGDRLYVDKRRGYRWWRTSTSQRTWGGRYWLNGVGANLYTVETDVSLSTVRVFSGTTTRSELTRGAFSGAHDGADNAAVLTDSDASFGTNDLIGLTVNNTTDGSSGTITANTPTTITATLGGGTDNDWDIGDTYTIAAGGLFTFQGTWSATTSHVTMYPFTDNGVESLVIHGFNPTTSTENIAVVQMDSVTPRVIAEITTAANNFPDASSGYYTCPGLVEMDGYIFVGMVTGEIFNCPLNNITGTWDATDFISAERHADTLRYICKHKNNLVAMGDHSIEFFYNSGNPSGSPLSRREDLFYDVGVAHSTYLGSLPPVASNDDLIAFVGFKGYDTSTAGYPYGVYMIENFQLKKISTPSIDAWVNQSSTVSLHTLHDRVLIIVRDISTDVTFYYDTTSGLWAKLTIDGDTTPDIITCSEGWLFLSNGAKTYHFDKNWLGDGQTSTDNNIAYEIVTKEWDGGVANNKFISATMLVGQHSWDATPNDVNISWSDNGGETYCTARAVDLDTQRTLHRCGSTQRRKWKISNTSSSVCKLERLDLNVQGVPYMRKEGQA
jgi:hypothetical protein